MEQESIQETRGAAQMLSFRLGSTMKDAVSKARKVSDAEANAFQYLCLVVEAFRMLYFFLLSF